MNYFKIYLFITLIYNKNLIEMQIQKEKKIFTVLKI